MKMPELPKPEFKLLWKSGEYKVTKPSIGDTDVYTADQMLAYGRLVAVRCAELCGSMAKKVGRSNQGEYLAYCDAETAIMEMADEKA